MTIQNPFRPTKFEAEEWPLVYVSDEARRQFSIGNLFFTGKRGCGKTTCLKIADTEFQLRCQNFPSNIECALHPKLLGVYINMNRRPLPSFINIPRTPLNKKIVRSEEACEQLRFEFLELSLIRVALTTVSSLCRTGHYAMSPAAEANTTSAISEAYRLPDERNIEVMVRQIEQRMTTLLNFSRGVIDDLDFESRLELKLHDVIAELIRSLRLSQDIEFVRFLIDDCEVFHSNYQKCINTLVRSAKGVPLWWSCAYVHGKFDPISTHIPNQTSTREERTIHYLDRQRLGVYKKFIDGVVKLRVTRSGAINKQFDVMHKLSNFEINELIASSIATSKKPRVQKFSERAEEAALDGNIPYYEQFLKDRGIETKSGDALRKKNVTAYVNLCSRYGLHVKYAGEGIVRALSDGCIRDYLECIAAIYDTYTGEGSGKNFFDEAIIPIDVQDAGCKEASSQRLSVIKDYTEASGFLLEKLVLCLGSLVKRVQSDEGMEPLQNPDRAVFSLKMKEAAYDKDAFALIRSGMVDGYILEVIPKKAAEGVFCFRLHRQFAPNFEYSYREDEEKLIPIHWLRLREIRRNEVTEPGRWAEQVFNEWRGANSNTHQGTLGDF